MTVPNNLIVFTTVRNAHALQTNILAQTYHTHSFTQTTCHMLYFEASFTANLEQHRSIMHRHESELIGRLFFCASYKSGGI